MINLLLDRLPTRILAGAREIPINSDFRASVQFELLIQDPEYSDTEKISNALSIYYPNFDFNRNPDLITSALQKALWFYSCGKDERPLEKKDANTDEEENAEPSVYSFEYDSPYIYAAFMEVYKIDLRRIRYFHWWQFRALFNALPDTCQFMKIVGYRSMKITSNMSKEQKAFYRKMQKLYALPQSQKEIDQSKALIEALKKGEDISGLIG